MSPVSNMGVLIAAVGGLLSLGGLLAVVWALFHDRARGRRRCPKCWYDLAGTPGMLRCPECGHEAERESGLHRTRRRRGRAIFGFVLMAAGLSTALGPGDASDAVLGAVPLGLWRVVLPQFDGLAERTFAATATGVNRMTYYTLPGRATGLRVRKWKRLLVAEYIASLVREGNTGRALFDLDQVPFNLQSEAWLVEQAARRQLGSPTASVRWSDIQLLGALLSTSAGSLAELDKMVLIEMDQQVLAAAVTLFAKRKQAPSKESLVHAGTIVNEAEYQTLCRVATYLPGQAGEVLGQFCNSDKPALVLVAAGCVPAVGPSCESGTPGLVRLLDSKYEVDRSRACEALGAIGPGARAALPALRLAARGDPDGVVRWHACEALVSIGRVEPALVAGALGDALSDEFRAIRIEAAKGLATFGKGAAPASEQLRAALKDRDEDVVRWAQNALEALGDK